MQAVFSSSLCYTLLSPQVWNLMPLDPMAWLVMYSEHQAALSDLIAANMQHRLPLEAVRDAATPQVQVYLTFLKSQVMSDPRMQLHFDEETS